MIRMVAPFANALQIRREAQCFGRSRARGGETGRAR